jgi:antitoxin component of MazEF toxin-antitoxin module
LAVRIPKRVAESARLSGGDLLEIRATAPGTVQIRSKKKKPSLAQLVRAIRTGNRHRETDWGVPRGNELW